MYKYYYNIYVLVILSKKFDELSQYPGERVDSETGEITVIEDNVSTGVVRPGRFAPSSYSQSSIDTARDVTSKLCEDVLSAVTGGRKVKRGNNRGYDIIVPGNRKLEAKVGRVGNSAVIKQNQLFEFDADFWGFMFYRTFSNLPPAYFTSQKKMIGPREYLKRRIFIVGVFIFPTPVIKYFWNTADVKKGIISSTGISHRPFTISRAEGLISDNEVPGIRREGEYIYGRHRFPYKSIDFEL